MPGKARPSLIHKTLENVERCNLSNTDKKCIQEVFKRYEERWIAIEEKLPEPGILVLGYITNAGSYHAVYECAMVNKGNFYFPVLNEYRPISHWMPLPEGPKEVSK